MTEDIINFKQYLKNLNYSENTIISYVKDIEKGIEIIKKYKKQESISVDEIINLGKSDWREVLSKIHETLNVKSILRFLASWNKWAKYQSINNKHSVLINMKKPRYVENNFNYIDEKNEINIFLNSFEKKIVTWQDQRNLILVYLLYSTGIRINEALSLKWTDIHEKYIKILGKGSKIRFVPLFEFLKNYLNSYKEIIDTKNNENIFISDNNKQLHACSVARIFRNQCKTLNITSINPHQLRHSCASGLLKEGCSLRYIQLLLGHASLEVTKIYIKYSNEELKEIHNNILDN